MIFITLYEVLEHSLYVTLMRQSFPYPYHYEYHHLCLDRVPLITVICA